SANVVVASTGGVTLNGLRGNLLSPDDSLKDIYNVESTVANMPVTLNTGTSNDTVNVGSDPVNLPQSKLDGIQGLVTVNGRGGNTALNYNDQGNVSGNSFQYIVTDSNLSRAQLFFPGVGNPIAQVTYTGVQALNVHDANGMGTGQEIVYVQGTPAGTTT